MPLRPAIHLCHRGGVSGLFGGALFGPRLCHAQSLANTNHGFQINRYEPTSAGEWSFLVDHPWYSSTRGFAAGLTLNYAHNPLVFGFRDQNGAFLFDRSLIAHQLIGNLDVAVSFLDRFLVSARCR